MSSRKSFQVRLGERSHPVHVGQGLLADASVWPEPTASRKALLCLDAHLAEKRGPLLASLRAAGWEPECEILQGSEALKDFHTLFPLYGRMLEVGLQRRSLLVAVGGGTVGDAMGFLASTYLRGIAWVSVPSTLLAQVDSGLGGKTGVNHPAGKNLIGAIWQPAAIVCDTDLLKDLGDRDIYSGLGEMLKYGLIADAELWHWLKAHIPDLLARDSAALAEGIYRSLQIKARYVEADEPDLSGVRAVLNFGHTFGHALEAVAGYGAFRHGEAVAWGMKLAARASRRLGWLPVEQAAEIQQVLGDLPLPPLPDLDQAALLQALGHDKKREGGAVQTLLLKRIGEVATAAIEIEIWREWIADFIENG